MTNNRPTDERLVNILSETQATINEHNRRQVRGSVEVDARLFEAVLIEAQLYRAGSNDFGGRTGRTDLRSTVLSEIGDFFAGFGGLGEPETLEEMQRELTMRVGRILNDHIVNYPRCEVLVETLKECRIARDAAQAELQEHRTAVEDKDLLGVIDALEHPAGINAAGKQVVRRALAELQERRKADNSEPVSFDELNAAVAEVTGGNQHAWDANIYKGHQEVPFMNYNSLARIVDKYRVPQPAPVVPESFVTAEHRRVIEMLLNVCGAAFELADDSCQQDVDGEECHVVPDDAFQKLSDALDEIENTLPTEGVDRPDVFLAWSAMPRAALKSILQAGNSPVTRDGLALVPKRLTAENGAKSVLSGEFSETKFINCPECFGDDECETCDGSGRIEITVPVTWTTIKEIWAKGIEHFAAAPKQENVCHSMG